MYRLTDRRLKKAEAILEKYRKQLHDTGHIRVVQFEKDLRQCWKLGYQKLKDIARALVKMERYKFLAAYYMQHSNPGTGVASEFKPVLARLYGLRCYDSEEREERRKAFWGKLGH